MNKISRPLLPCVTFISLSLTSLAFLVAPTGQTAERGITIDPSTRVVLMSAAMPALVAAYHNSSETTDKTITSADVGGIREQIPEKYSARYQQWKKEFLATETGREQWASYEHDPNFTLTLVVSRDNPEGGTTGNYKWDETGKLIAATITLGCRLDAGFPNPVYFPVMNSLVPTETTRKIDSETLAATKIAHEFGHVNRTAKGDSTLYQLQGQLMPEYNQIFLTNGRDSNDPRLIELARQMGGTPVGIWEDREYWGETNAMLFLSDRFSQDGFRCLLFSRIKRSVDLYAPSYEKRFLNVAQSTPSARHCDW